MPALHKNRVKMTVTGTPGTGTITLNAASSAHQSFAAAYGANATVDILITEGTSWEVARNCTYTHSGTTVTRGTLEASSTGSAVSFTSAATVEEILTAEGGNVFTLGTKGAIQGLDISYSSTTAIAVASGICAINGKLLSYAGATLTSGSTWKDLNNATVTIGANKSYFVYAFDNAGTLEIRIQDYAAGTYGGAPTWDSDYDYWKGPSVGVQARRIGKFWTNGSSNIVKFTSTTINRSRKHTIHGHTDVIVISAGTSTTFGGGTITVTPYISTDDAEVAFSIYAQVTGNPVFVALSIDGTNTFCESYIYVASATIMAVWLPNQILPNTGNFSYNVVSGGTGKQASLYLQGSEFLI